MSRTMRKERTTPKGARKGPKQPRMSDFARDYYRSKGYEVGEYCDASVAYREADQ